MSVVTGSFIFGFAIILFAALLVMLVIVLVAREIIESAKEKSLQKGIELKHGN